MLTSQQFDRTRKLALQLAGIELSERHRELLANRSRRLRIPQPAGIEGLLGAAEEGDPQASRQVIGLVTTNFTGFFRHPRHFEIAAEHAVRAIQHAGSARLWSAAAATGEEPYSLAMALMEACRHDDPPATILATDIDAEALAIAAQGEYGDRSLQTLAPLRRTRFFTATASPGRQRIAPAGRRLVEFHPLNLVDAAWPIAGAFHVIFCRNVLMYLENRHRCPVLERLASLLAPDGLLLLDPTEHLGQAAHLFTPEAGGVYRRRGQSFCPATQLIYDHR
jgi:chemotaxis protein methyltransferase CheR